MMKMLWKTLMLYDKDSTCPSIINDDADYVRTRTDRGWSVRCVNTIYFLLH